MRCIIYGLSTCRQQLEVYLKDDIEIVGYSDSFANHKFYNGKKFYKPNELKNVKFDKVIIAINKIVDCIEVEKSLTEIGINKSKIITIYRFLKYIYELKNNSSLIDKTFTKSESKVEGMVFGLSYGAMAIVPKYLNFNCYNFCRGSQDLYYTLAQIKYIKEKYKNKISDLKYIILDMYTYTYFNYDVSLTKNSFDFIYYNGFDDDTHNLSKNINYSDEIVNTVTLELTSKEKDTFEKVFKKDLIIRKDDRYYYNEEEISNIIDEEEINRYYISPLGHSSIEGNLFSETETENIKIFEEILKEISDINSNIKIYLVLIPRYKLKEEKMEKIESRWKNRFYDVINNARKKYKFDILDMKKIEKISGVRENYSDLEHLNYNGAVKFSKMLCDSINMR